MSTVALIPTYQPQGKLLDVVEGLAREGVHPIVIDDGSGVEYADVLARVADHADVIGYDTNCGKGHALKFGLEHVLACYGAATVIVTVDGDGQHASDDAARCAREAMAHPGTLVLGCRDFDAAGVPARSRMGNVITRGVYRLASGVSVQDTQTGLRAFTIGLATFLIDIAGDRYEWEMNVLLACPANGVAIREVSIATIYRDGNAGSHFRAIRDSLRIYAGILAFVASSLAGFCIDYLLFGLLVGPCGVALANVMARVASAGVNFLLNRRVVFRSRERLSVTAARYALVATAILMGNTLAMALAVDVIGVAALPAKLAVELGFFLCSWMLQSRFVFPRKEIAHAL